jgi:hypothetical protein
MFVPGIEACNRNSGHKHVADVLPFCHAGIRGIIAWSAVSCMHQSLAGVSGSTRREENDVAAPFALVTRRTGWRIHLAMARPLNQCCKP